MGVLFYKRDLSGTTPNLNLTTNQETMVFTGVVTPDTAVVQVSVNDSAWSTDTDLVEVLLGEFTIPNPGVTPGGLPLRVGVNTVRLRSISILGITTAVITAVVDRVQALDLAGTRIPSGLSVERTRGAVVVRIGAPISDTAENDTLTGLPLPDLPEFLGFHLYASASPAGTTGYFRVNESLIVGGSVYDERLLLQGEFSPSWPDSRRKLVRVRVTEEDEFGIELTERLNQKFDVNSIAHRVRVRGVVDQYKLDEFYTFTHTRSGGPGIINADLWAAIPAADPLYYVATAVYRHGSVEIETPYSQEVLGAPLILDTTLRDLPGRSRNQIVLDAVQLIQRADPDITVIPGSTTQDVSLNPFSSEAERVWFLCDFIHRSQSFLTLLQIDDANADGESDAVVSSAYKSALKAALGFTSDEAVQNLIDAQFEKLAANHGKSRLPGRASVGSVVFYTKTKPTKDLPVGAGTVVTAVADGSLPAWRFKVGGSYVMRASTVDAYYNPRTKQWELVADITAENAGKAGNRSAGTIKTAQGVSGLKVVNRSATVFGTDRESNAELAYRAMLAPSSVDTGTEGGYLQVCAETLGLIRARVVKSGDSLMMRDYDPVRNKHIGGKVDVYIQGVREREVTETFAFAYEIAKDVAAVVVDPVLLVFRIQDSRLTATTPLVELLDNPSQGLGVRNATAGQDYNLSGAVILDFQTFQLNSGIPQPPTGLDDVVTVDYRLRVDNRFTPNLQPVRRVISVTGETSGPLESGINYKLVKLEDPLLNGESTIAEDYVEIIRYNNKPTGETVVVNDEVHVLIGTTEELLGSVGINLRTLRVFSEDRLTEYDGPDSPSADFEVIEGTPTTPAAIVRTSNSAIVSGQTVSVDYQHDENFVISYVVNDLLQELQAVLDRRRHITADVLAKQAVDNSVNLEATIQLKPGSSKELSDPKIRTAVSLELDQKKIGEGSAQSDVVRAIDTSDGVDYVVLPLARMAYADGSQKLRERLSSAYTPLPSLNAGSNAVFILSSPLLYPTVDGGGVPDRHRGVFMDDVPMNLVDLSLVGLTTRGAAIIGASGAVIVGYSDDATLAGDGFMTPESRSEERIKRTGNRAVVSLLFATADNPSKHDFTVSYLVFGDAKSHDLKSSEVESLSLGELVLTYS